MVVEARRVRLIELYVSGLVVDCPPAIVLATSDFLQDLLHIEMGLVGQTGQPCGEHKKLLQMSTQNRTLCFQCL